MAEQQWRLDSTWNTEQRETDLMVKVAKVMAQGLGAVLANNDSDEVFIPIGELQMLTGLSQEQIMNLAQEKRLEIRQPDGHGIFVAYKP